MFTGELFARCNHNVAVPPDDAFVYPALGLHNPFPLDWMVPSTQVAEKFRAEVSSVSGNRAVALASRNSRVAVYEEVA